MRMNLMMMTKIEERWSALEPAPDKPIFQLLDAEHPLKLYIGREMTGEYLFLMVDPERPPKLNSMRSVKISSVERNDGHWSLILTLMHADLASVFALLCEDLVESTRHLARGSSGVKLISRRLATWRRLMEEGGSGLLSPSEVRGLVGELLVLESYFIDRFGSIDAVRAWGGPFGSDQDFQFAEEAWEIKTIHTDSLAIQISSENQLNSTARQIWLIVLSLDEIGGSAGHSLNGLVARLRALLDVQPEARDLFDERLVAAQYMVRGEYDFSRFKITNTRTFQVHGDFPRITTSGIVKGVTEVKYKVLLDSCKPYEIETPFTVV